MAGGVGATVGPRMMSAREMMNASRMGRMRGMGGNGWGLTRAALGPLSIAAMEGAREARRAQEKVVRRRRGKQAGTDRLPMLFLLLGAGAAVGAGAAYMMRHRRQKRWDELGGREESMIDSAKERAAQATGRVADATAHTARTAADRTSAAADKAAGKVGSAADRMKGAADDMASRSRNNRT